MSTARPPAILLGGAGTALSVARGLSADGIEVCALGASDDPLRYSRRRRGGFVDMGAGTQLQERFLDWLEHGPGEGVVLPCADDGIEVIARNRSELVRLGYVPIEADDDVLLAMLDKERTFELAQKAGVEAPWVGTVNSAEAAVEAAARVGYPCVLKPRDSHEFARWFSRKAFVVHGEAELEAAVEQTAPFGVRMMVSEIVPGPDTGFCSYYSYLDERGEPLFGFTKRKPRQHPPKFGNGCFHIMESVPEAAELGLRFVRGVGARGLVNVEFKRDERDGRLKLIECNHRFTASNELMRRCGMNLALFAYRRTLGLPDLPPIRPRREGVGLWYPSQDVRAFLAYRRRGELSAREWIRSLLRPQYFPVATLDDPLVSPATSVRKLRRALARARGPSR